MNGQQKQDEIGFIKYIPHMLIGFLVVLNVLPFLAPILAHYGYDGVAGLIYKAYSIACHQKAHRSLHLFDHQSGWCVRDTFIWSSMLVAAIFVFTSRKRLAGISLKMAILLGLPMALDGSIQLVSTISSIYSKSTPYYESTNSLRALTGTFFGIAIAMYLFPRLKAELRSDAVIPDSHVPIGTGREQ
jgi:uncharacterized membrane protein